MAAPHGLPLCIAALAMTVGGCEFRYPEVVVANETHERVLVRSIGFSGCKWDTVLAFGAATVPDRCLPGEDKVHFQKLDIDAYCAEQGRGGVGSESCGGPSSAVPEAGVDREPPGATPLWFNYQTTTVKRVDYDGLYLFRITRAGGHLHIWHLISRARVNEIHAGAGECIRNDELAPATVTARLLEGAGYRVLETRDDDREYLVSARAES
jgi:hypothetical protein